jgi:diacylglycerol kinase (ATP)
MNKDTRFSIHSRAKSFKYAFEGVLRFFKKEHNAWLHLLATVYVIIVSVLVGVTSSEATALIIAVALVWITEMINTCIEKVMDMISEEYDERIKVIKDIAAGAVLVAAAAALVIGLIVFIPKFVHV